MNEVIDNIFRFLSEALPDIRIAVVIIAMMPLVETRLAIPFALRSGIKPIWSWLYCFIGSSLVVPLLLIFFIPLVKWLSKLRIFKRTGEHVLESFSEKAGRLGGGFKAYFGIFMFSVLPLPLTGVWTASAVAALLLLEYKKSLLSIVCGNAISSAIITMLCYYFIDKINLIILAITILAILALVTLILKSLLSPSKQMIKTQAVTREGKDS